MIRNVGSDFIMDPFFEVKILEGPSCPCTVVNGPAPLDPHTGNNEPNSGSTVIGDGQVGSKIKPGPARGLADTFLAPGEEFTLNVGIHMEQGARESFVFFVDVFGRVVDP